MTKEEYNKHLYLALQNLVTEMQCLIEAGGRFEWIGSLEEASEILELGKSFYE